MGKSIKIKKILNIILILLLIISCCFSATGCLPSSNGSGGGSGGGSSSGGSGSGGNAGGSGSGSSSSTTCPIEPTSVSEDDFFSGVLIMYDAGHAGYFYDSATEESKTFKDLLHRQFETFTSHLLYALNVIYGDDTAVPSSTAVVNLLSINSELGSLWGKYDLLGVNNATILSEGNASSGYILNTNDYTNTKDLLASSLSAVAGLGIDEVNAGQFYFNQAILGGYNYEKDEDSENPTGRFTNDLNSSYAWDMNVQGQTTSEAIRDGIANVVCSQSYSIGNVSDIPYEECIENIEYLGFSQNDLINIANYVKNVVIGRAYANDESIRQNVPFSAVDISAVNEVDMFPQNTNIHYYKGYNYVVDILVERMANITTAGIYTTDTTFDSFADDSKIMTYTIMPRTNIEIKRCSELFTEDKEESGGMSGFDTASSGLNGDKYTPILDDIKLKQIVFLPKLSESIKKDYLEDLEEYYEDKGEDYTQHIDYRFDIMSVNMSFNASKEAEENAFILLPSFTIKAEGEVVHSGYVDNEPASMNMGTSSESFYDKYALNLDYVYSNANDLASYSVGQSMSGAKFSDYNGVKVFDDNNTPSSDYFHSADGEDLLITATIASTFSDKSLYSVSYNENGQFTFVFNGGDNFLQVDLAYFGEDSLDIYDPAKANILTPQIIDLVTLSIWT